MPQVRKTVGGISLACLLSVSAIAGLDVSEVASGLLEALKVGIENAVTQTSSPDGFFKNEAIKILLPEKLETVAKLVEKVGGSSVTEALVEKMNRAAEAAAPAAKDIFLASIAKLSFADAMAILKGKENEATLFLQTSASEDLKAAMLPIVTQSIESVGALKAYNDLLAKAKGANMLGQALDLDAFNLNEYVTEKAVSGLFHVMGEEEKKIRQDPKARVTGLLGKVFGD